MKHVGSFTLIVSENWKLLLVYIINYLKEHKIKRREGTSLTLRTPVHLLKTATGRSMASPGTIPQNPLSCTIPQNPLSCERGTLSEDHSSERQSASGGLVKSAVTIALSLTSAPSPPSIYDEFQGICFIPGTWHWRCHGLLWVQTYLCTFHKVQAMFLKLMISLSWSFLTALFTKLPASQFPTVP